MNTLRNMTLAIALLLLAGTAFAQSPVPILRNLAAMQLGLDTAAVTVSLVDELRLSGDASEYQFKFAAIPRGRTVVRAMSTRHRDVAFTIRVDVWADALVARVPLARGSLLNPEDFVTVRRDVTHVTPATPDALNTLRTRRRIPAGSILTQDAIEPIPDVSRGDRVTLVAQSGLVRVTRVGVALKDARIGESVRIRLDGRTIVPATVTGAHLCAVGP